MTAHWLRLIDKGHDSKQQHLFFTQAHNQVAGTSNSTLYTTVDKSEAAPANLACIFPTSDTLPRCIAC